MKETVRFLCPRCRTLCEHRVVFTHDDHGEYKNVVLKCGVCEHRHDEVVPTEQIKRGRRGEE